VVVIVGSGKIDLGEVFGENGLNIERKKIKTTMMMNNME